MIWYTQVSYGDAVKLAASVIAVLLFLVALPTRLLGWYRRTLGARRDLHRKLNRLACGSHEDYIRSLFGEPLFKSSKDDAYHLAVYPTRWAWVSFLYSLSEVRAFSVTTTRRGFKYRLNTQTNSQMSITLGRDEFAALGESKAPMAILSYVGAHRSGYRELHYFGNPASYLYFAISANAVGYRYMYPAGMADISTGQYARDENNGMPYNNSEPDPEVLEKYRHRATVNTFTVISPAKDDHVTHLSNLVEVEQDHVRLYHEDENRRTFNEWRRYQRYRVKRRLTRTARPPIGPHRH